MILDYAVPRTPTTTTARGKWMAPLAMICGVCSGPAGGLLLQSFWDRADALRNGDFDFYLGLVAFGCTIGSSFLFGCLAKARLSIPTPRHRLVFALIGIIAPLVWGAASLVFAAMLYTALNSPPKR